MRSDCKEIERWIIKYVNYSRKKRKISSLRTNWGLTKVARNHTKRMARKGRIWHGDGVYIAKENISYRKGFWGFIESLFSNYSYSSGGENVAMNSSKGSNKNIAKSFHIMWMKSPGHRKNILNENFSLIGVGVIKNKRGYFSTQLFFG